MFKKFVPVFLLTALLLVNNMPKTSAKEIDTVKWDGLYSQSLEDYDKAYDEYTDISDAFPTPEPETEPEPQGESVLGEESELTDNVFAMAEPERLNRLVLITGPEWCGPCMRFEENVIDKLLYYPANGWIINDTPQAHIQKFIVDADGNTSPEAKKYMKTTSVPCLVVIRDGKEVKRYYGLQQFKYTDMAKLINGTYGVKSETVKKSMSSSSSCSDGNCGTVRSNTRKGFLFWR